MEPKLFPTYHIHDFLKPRDRGDFDISRYEEMDDPEHLVFPHKHAFYEVMFITDGYSRQKIDYVDYHIQPNSLFLISPGQLHQWQETEDIAGFSLLFTEAFFLHYQPDKNKLFELSYLDDVHSNPYLHLTGEEAGEVQLLLQLLHTEYHRYEPSRAMLASLLNVFLLTVQRYVSRNKSTPAPAQIVLYKRFYTLLAAELGNHHTVSYYADRLHVTPDHLNKLVKAVTGIPASAVIRQRLVLEAKQLLSFTDTSIAEVASALGWDDPAYFARVFKQEAKVTPLHFRRQMQDLS